MGLSDGALGGSAAGVAGPADAAAAAACEVGTFAGTTCCPRLVRCRCLRIGVASLPPLLASESLSSESDPPSLLLLQVSEPVVFVWLPLDLAAHLAWTCFRTLACEEGGVAVLLVQSNSK
jgi:hypothetical protein